MKKQLKRKLPSIQGICQLKGIWGGGIYRRSIDFYPDVGYFIFPGDRMSVIGSTDNDKMNHSRNSSFELFRIIFMFCIMMHHSIVHGFDKIDFDGIQYADIICQFLAYAGNNFFFMLSGFFFSRMIVTPKKVIAFCFHCLIISYLVGVAVFSSNGGFNDLYQILYILMPVSSGANWFVSIYFIFLCFAPFIKKTMIYLNDHSDENRRFCIVLVVLYSLVALIDPWSQLASELMRGIAGIYLGNYAFANRNSFRMANKAIAKGLLLLFAMPVAVVSASWFFFGDNRPVYSFFKGYFISNMSPFVVAFSFLLIVLLSRVEFHSRIINRIAASTLTIYLFHDHRSIRGTLWFSILRVQDHLGSPILYGILCAFCIGILCFAVDIIRAHTTVPLLRVAMNRVEKAIKQYRGSLSDSAHP